MIHAGPTDLCVIHPRDLAYADLGDQLLLCASVRIQNGVAFCMSVGLGLLDLLCLVHANRAFEYSFENSYGAPTREPERALHVFITRNVEPTVVL